MRAWSCLVLSLLLLAAAEAWSPWSEGARSLAQIFPGTGAAGSARSPDEDDRGRPAEPWILEGDSLWGSRDVGTEILNPSVQQGSLLILARHGRLNPERTIITFTDQVNIRDSLRVLNADKGTYRRLDRILDLEGNVSGFGPAGKMRSGRLHYDRANEILTLLDDPELVDSTRVIRAREIVYEASTDFAEAIGSVRILMRADSTWLYSEHATYDRVTGEIQLTGNPWLFRPGFSEESDLTVHADTLMMNEVSRIGRANGNVRIERGEVRATSRSAEFELVRNLTKLYGRPVASDPDGEIEADTMLIRVVSNGPDILRAFGSVEANYRPRERPGETNVVVGDTLRAELSGSMITDLEMRGNAVSLLLPTLTDARRGTGRNVSRADYIRVDLEAGEARRVDLIKNASGTYLYPGDGSTRRLRDREYLDSLFFAIDFARALAQSERADSLAALAAKAVRDSVMRADSLAIDPAEQILVPDDEGGLIDYANRRFGERPLPVENVVEHFLSKRDLDLSDSLLTSFDRLFDERVDYSGDTIRFYVREDRIALRGNGVLEYQGNALESEEIDYDAEKDLVIALGQPALRDPNTRVIGTRMLYRTDEREGMVFQGRTEFEGGRYYGEQIKKQRGDELLVKEGDYTTCDHDPPHYHFHSKKMKMILDDKVIARPVVLYIRNIPVFGIPYYFFPLDHGRRSGILLPDLEFGFNRNRGRFVRNLGYYWAISDYMDAKAWMDYLDRGPDIKFNGEFRYRVRYLLDGQVRGSWADERSGLARSVRWDLTGNHRHDLWENGVLNATADFRSDKDYVSDYDFAADVDDRLKRQLRSTVSFSQRWSSASLSASAQRTQYLDETTANGLQRDEDLPSIDFRLNSFAVGRGGDEAGRNARLPFLSSTYVTLSSALRAETRKNFGEDAESNQAARISWSVSDTRLLGPFLKLSPGLSGNLAWFAEDLQGERNVTGSTWNGGLRVSSTLYGTMGDIPGPVEALRHVIEPSVRWSYSPENKSLTYVDSLGVRRPRIPSVGGISLSSAKSSRLAFSLSQRFHLKWRRGEEVIKKENLLTWDASSSYDLLSDDPRPMSNISNSFRLRPFSTFDTGARMEVDPYDWVRRSYSIDAGLSLNSTMFARQPGDTTQVDQELEYGEFGDGDLRGSNIGNRYNEGDAAPAIPWNFRLAYRLSGSRGSSFKSHTLGFDGSITPTTNWQLRGGTSYDLEDKDFQNHNFTLTRDLHCWQFNFTYRSGGSYYFHISVKDIPEVKYETER